MKNLRQISNGMVQRRRRFPVNRLSFSRVPSILGKRTYSPKVSSHIRAFSSEAEDDPMQAEREAMEVDVLIVGGGPAGMTAAIRLKQLDADLSIVVVEKAAEVGAHILSGNVLETRALDELLPDWREDETTPIKTKAAEDKFYYLTESSKFWVPTPPMADNHAYGNYITSLAQVTRWLGNKAEEMGVDVFPGFAASEVLYNSDGGVRGVATGDVGIGKDGKAKDTFMRGMELHAKQTIFAEGCRGSCSESIIEKFNLREGKDPQIYGLGVKEVWEVPEETFKSGYIQHTLGWPLDNVTYGGSFLYHMDPNLVLVGFVVGLDYENPYLSPYMEFQRWKHHPAVAPHLEGGTCIQYGARCINEGGFFSIPKLTFPGGMLVGCSAGFVNVPKVKGTHTAMKSAMLGAEAVYEKLQGNESITADSSVECDSYQTALENSWVWEELKEVRNYHNSFHKPGRNFFGTIYSGISAFVTKGMEPWDFRNDVKDCDRTKPKSECTPIDYPQPDGKLSFDLLTNLARSGTNHEGDQPAHLRVKEDLADIPSEDSFPLYAAPETRFCPAKVYEYTTDDDGVSNPQLVINAQNCVHCKCCSIKMRKEYINWTVPEGGGGPAYELM